ncbi:hypothetical protein TNCT_722221, partial [Trichonephila clavata]
KIQKSSRSTGTHHTALIFSYLQMLKIDISSLEEEF